MTGQLRLGYPLSGMALRASPPCGQRAGRPGTQWNSPLDAGSSQVADDESRATPHRWRNGIDLFDPVGYVAIFLSAGPRGAPGRRPRSGRSLRMGRPAVCDREDFFAIMSAIVNYRPDLLPAAGRDQPRQTVMDRPGRTSLQFCRRLTYRTTARMRWLSSSAGRRVGSDGA